MGMSKQADELVVGMNRAAEMAVQEATPILVDSVKKMSVKDAKGILTGGDDAATQYFRETTSAELTDKFQPIVQKMTAPLAAGRAIRPARESGLPIRAREAGRCKHRQLRHPQGARRTVPHDR